MSKHAEKKKPSRKRRNAGKKTLRSERRTVIVVDDDESALSAISRLIRSAGFKVVAFSEPRALLAQELVLGNT
ncbi:MAG: hypothetical protein ACRETL_03340, partial [Gammaproteobacteria bacterium]